ncbi:mechanosensitive ion channel family protein [Effusibacillus lacus]|uniref:Mechanosensitive ion channel protein MscS n=1 Tax=Effusibacillus lacus TaxID=1348429 RepID=A0A292YL73_9BACL|nr:mechanosensitive ion channel family protein [Effusibacillus lacus]TCS75179.1 small conductance mechanosensitive channel [Effusibacillus lacus]GAX89124.1 mechanosensitive ion channel protein MscS [Effusibacillus lacus]
MSIWTQIQDLYQKMIEKTSNPAFWEDLLSGFFNGLVKIAVLLVLAKIVIRLGSGAINRLLMNRAVRWDERRSRTLSVLSTNVLKYVVYFFVAITILEQFIEIKTLLAGAGIVGLAVGFGAQSLVKDVITGFFIIVEDQFAVGDEIQTATYRGTVEEIGLRITTIRAWTGEVHIIPNGQITNVTNFSKANSLAVIDVGVAYEEDLDRVFETLKEVLRKAQEELPTIVGEPQVLGVQNFGPSEVTVRVTADCVPTKHIPVARELRRRIKQAFDEKGIEIPYPKQVLMTPGTQDGKGTDGRATAEVSEG